MAILLACPSWHLYSWQATKTSENECQVETILLQCLVGLVYTISTLTHNKKNKVRMESSYPKIHAGGWQAEQLLQNTPSRSYLNCRRSPRAWVECRCQNHSYCLGPIWTCQATCTLFPTSAQRFFFLFPLHLDVINTPTHA